MPGANINLLPLLPSRLNKKKPHLIKKNELANLQSNDYYFQTFNSQRGGNEPGECNHQHHCCCCISSSSRVRNKYEHTMLLHNMPENKDMVSKSFTN
jgi:hypothetical protein